MTRDEQINKLMEKVVAKKAEIASASRPNWETNCSFKLPNGTTNCSFKLPNGTGERINIQVANKEEDLVLIISTLVYLRDSTVIANKLLGTSVEFKYGNFTFDNWLNDVKSRLNKIQVSAKKAELKKIEETLDKLLSPEAKADLELKMIAEMLN